jgi:hypothetical protein
MLVQGMEKRSFGVNAAACGIIFTSTRRCQLAGLLCCQQQPVLLLLNHAANPY